VRVGLGEMGRELLLEGQRVLPARLLDGGFMFAHENLAEGLAATLDR
jgi:NAD dependent epimerase/dehydratase family enzyme